VRILFHITATSVLRHFLDVVLTLADRGHQIRVAYTEEPLQPPAEFGNSPLITFVQAPPARTDTWREAAIELRALRDYLRYLQPPFAAAEKLRARAFRKGINRLSGGAHRHVSIRCPRCAHDIADEALIGALTANYPDAPGTMARRLALIESAIPTDARVDRFLDDERPDVVVVTPLIRIGSDQPEYVKSARAKGIPVAFPVFSWDNLSTKGLIHVHPDRVLVWNEWQKEEAVLLHAVPAESVHVTGAPRFDRFFALQPQIPRDEFCRVERLNPAQPIVTYLCSSEFVADAVREREFVLRWIDAVRRHPDLASCNVVIRPHPRHKAVWKKFDTGRPHVTVIAPRSISTDQSLLELLHHSAAVVGLNTSAQLEAAIAGRPVLTLLVPEFEGGQTGTLHFRYLLREHGGFVDVAADFDTHRAQLAAAVHGEIDRDAIRTFTNAFLRPHGHDHPAAPIMADAIETLAGAGHQSWPKPLESPRRRRGESAGVVRDTAADRR